MHNAVKPHDTWLTAAPEHCSASQNIVSHIVPLWPLSAAMRFVLAQGSGEQAEMHSSDREELQMRRASSSSATTSYSGTLLPSAARSCRERRHFSASSRDASPGESSAKKLTPAFRRRQRRNAAGKRRMGLPREGAFTSTSIYGSMADRDDRQPPEASKTAASAEQPVTGHRSRLRERAGKVPEEARRSKKTQKLEAMAAEMLREDEAIDGPQASRSAEPSPAKHLKVPPYDTSQCTVITSISLHVGFI